MLRDVPPTGARRGHTFHRAPDESSGRLPSRNALGMAIPTLTVSAPRDLLALVPYRLGFTPCRSIVLVCLRGPRRRVGLVARVDLPPTPGEALRVCAERLVAHAAADGANAVVLVVYTDPVDGVTTDRAVDRTANQAAHAATDRAVDAATNEAADAPTDGATNGATNGPPSASDVLRHVEAAAGAAHLDLLDAWQVTSDRYVSLLCGDPRCCRPDGEPLSDLDGSVVSAEMVALGCVVGPDRDAVLGDLTPADATRRSRVERAAAAERRRIPSTGARRSVWRSRQVTAWRRELAALSAGADGEVPPDAAGRLLAGIEDSTVRDAVMLSVVPGSGLAPESLAAHGPATEVLALLDRVFGPDDAVRPDESVLDAAARVLRSLVRQSTPPRAAAPLGLLAWMSWWLGDGAAARALVGRSLAADPGHRLALLLGEALDRGVPPGWAQRDRALDVAGEPRT